MVVILTFDRVGVTSRYLPSAIDKIPEWCNIAIIDSGSVDGTVDWVKSYVRSLNRPVRLELKRENPGKIAVVDLCKEGKFEYLLELDDDLFVPEGFIERMALMADLAKGKFGFIGFDMYWKDSSFTNRWVDAIRGESGPPLITRFSLYGDIGVMFGPKHYEYYGGDLFVNGACRLSRREIFKTLSPKPHGNDVHLNRVMISRNMSLGFVLSSNGEKIRHFGGSRKK